MKSSITPRVFLMLVFPVLLAVASPLRAEDAVQPPAASVAARDYGDVPLVITKGKFMRNEQSVPATLRNLVDLIRVRYRSANITIVGVEDVVIDDLTLHWRGYHGLNPDGSQTARLNPPLDGVLRALSAASGRKFEVSGFSPNDFLLTPGRDPAQSGRRFVEVFNLARLFSGNVDASLGNALRQSQIELEVMSKRYGDKHPDVESLLTRIEVLRKQLGQSARTPNEDEKRLEQIMDVVRVTLERLAPGEKPPEFQFHPGTNLLIVIGGEDAIDVTRKVVAALELNPG